MSTDPEGVPSSVVVFLTFESLNSDVYSLPASRASLSNHKCVVMVVFMMCLPSRVTSLPRPYPGPTLPSDDVSGQEGENPVRTHVSARRTRVIVPVLLPALALVGVALR